MQQFLRKLAHALYSRIKSLNVRGHLYEKWVHYTRRPFVIRDWQGNLYLQTKSDRIASNIKRNAVSDAINVTNLINKLVQKGWTCVDVGACIGAISVPLWRKATRNGRVISIEADPKNISRIKLNLLLNEYSPEDVYHFAIFNKNTEINLNVTIGENGWQSIGDPRQSTSPLMPAIEGVYSEKVPAVTLQEFSKMFSVDHIDFLKIDVEGSEIEVLQGCQEMLENGSIPFIVFEISPLVLTWFENRTHQDVIDYISKYNYSLYRVLDNGDLCKLDKNTWPENTFGDCLAVSPHSQAPAHLLNTHHE